MLRIIIDQNIGILNVAHFFSLKRKRSKIMIAAYARKQATSNLTLYLDPPKCQHTIKHPVSQMVWGCISDQGVDELHFVQKNSKFLGVYWHFGEEISSYYKGSFYLSSKRHFPG